jgi:hypothetical protein
MLSDSRRNDPSEGGKAVNHLGDTNKMVDTPRTDAHNWHDGDYDDPLHAFADFAKQLERELNAANERIKRLEEAGDGMRIWITVIRGYLPECTNNWLKAKEAKL